MKDKNNDLNFWQVIILKDNDATGLGCIICVVKQKGYKYKRDIHLMLEREDIDYSNIQGVIFDICIKCYNWRHSRRVFY